MAGSQGRENVLFHFPQGEQAPAGFTGPTIPAGAKRIVCMASSYIAMFDALGQVDKLSEYRASTMYPIHIFLHTKILSRTWAPK